MSDKTPEATSIFDPDKTPLRHFSRWATAKAIGHKIGSVAPMRWDGLDEPLARLAAGESSAEDDARLAQAWGSSSTRSELAVGLSFLAAANAAEADTQTFVQPLSMTALRRSPAGLQGMRQTILSSQQDSTTQPYAENFQRDRLLIPEGAPVFDWVGSRKQVFATALQAMAPHWRMDPSHFVAPSSGEEPLASLLSGMDRDPALLQTEALGVKAPNFFNRLALLLTKWKLYHGHEALLLPDELFDSAISGDHTKAHQISDGWLFQSLDVLRDMQALRGQHGADSTAILRMLHAEHPRFRSSKAREGAFWPAEDFSRITSMALSAGELLASGKSLGPGDLVRALFAPMFGSNWSEADVDAWAGQADRALAQAKAKPNHPLRDLLQYHHSISLIQNNAGWDHSPPSLLDSVSAVQRSAAVIRAALKDSPKLSFPATIVDDLVEDAMQIAKERAAHWARSNQLPDKVDLTMEQMHMGMIEIQKNISPLDAAHAIVATVLDRASNLADSRQVFYRVLAASGFSAAQVDSFLLSERGAIFTQACESKILASGPLKDDSYYGVPALALGCMRLDLELIPKDLASRAKAIEALGEIIDLRDKSGAKKIRPIELRATTRWLSKNYDGENVASMNKFCQHFGPEGIDMAMQRADEVARQIQKMAALVLARTLQDAGFSHPGAAPLESWTPSTSWQEQLDLEPQRRADHSETSAPTLWSLDLAWPWDGDLRAQDMLLGRKAEPSSRGELNAALSRMAPGTFAKLAVTKAIAAGELWDVRQGASAVEFDNACMAMARSFAKSKLGISDATWKAIHDQPTESARSLRDALGGSPMDMASMAPIGLEKAMLLKWSPKDDADLGLFWDEKLGSSPGVHHPYKRMAMLRMELASISAMEGLHNPAEPHGAPRPMSRYAPGSLSTAVFAFGFGVADIDPAHIAMKRWRKKIGILEESFDKNMWTESNTSLMRTGVAWQEILVSRKAELAAAERKLPRLERALIEYGHAWRESQEAAAAQTAASAQVALPQVLEDDENPRARRHHREERKPDLSEFPLSGATLAEVLDWARDQAGRFWTELPEKFSWSHLAAGSRRWHQEVIAREADNGAGWEPIGLSSPKGFEAVELCTSSALAAEGQAMRHCVGSYSSQCRDGGERIVSIRSAGRGVGTLQLSPGPSEGAWTISQLKGPCNAQVDDAVLAAAQALRAQAESISTANIGQEVLAIQEKVAQLDFEGFDSGAAAISAVARRLAAKSATPHANPQGKAKTPTA